MAIIIRNATNLQNMENNLSADYELGNDIDASETSGWDGGLGFDPIGTEAVPFTGTFDGKGYTITNLTINRPATSVVALFVSIDAVTIQNVTLANVSIVGRATTAALVAITPHGFVIFPAGKNTIRNCHSSGSVTGRSGVGGLLGYVFWIDILDCSSSCTVVINVLFTGGGLAASVNWYNQEASISNCFATGNITATPDTNGIIGGLVGDTDHVVINRSYATGTVFATGSKCGGFIGNSQEDVISECFATGNVISGNDEAGGFIAHSDGSAIQDCYSRGSVTGDSETGGFVGEMREVLAPSAPTIDNCYSTGLVICPGANVGGLLGFLSDGTVTDSFWDIVTSGQATSDGGTGKTTAQMKVVATFDDANWAIFSIWNLISTCNDGYPCLIGVGPCCKIASPGVDSTIVGNKVSLEAIRNIEMVYGGRFYIGKAGNAVYESRYHRNV